MSKKTEKTLRSYETLINPFVFIREVLGIEYLTPEQRLIIQAVWSNNKIAVKAAHNTGKTFTLALITITFLITNYNSIVLTTAPTARQVRDLLWAEINTRYSKAHPKLGGVITQTDLRIAPKWFATGLTAEAGKEEQSAVKFQGYHAPKMLIIIDEAVGVAGAIWEAIDGIASGENATILAVGNPSTVSCSFYSHLKQRDWKVISISALNHPNVSLKKEIVPGAVSYLWVKDKVQKWCEAVMIHDQTNHTFEFEGVIYKPNDLFMWKVLGEFPEQSTDTLIPLHKIQAAMEREQINGEEFNYMAIDVARFGNDNSVFAFNKGNNFTTKPYYHFDSTKLAGQAIHEINEHKPSKVAVDCDGIGGGVFDILTEAKNEGRISCELIELHGGATPLDITTAEEYKADQFLNLRSQMYWFFRNDIDLISIEENEDVKDCLSGIKYSYQSKGKIQIEKKEEIKKRIGHSPDIEDALVYANFLKYWDTELKMFIME